MICAWCDATFDPPHARGPKPRFCSASHRQMAHVQRVALKRAVAHLGEAEMLRAGWVHVDRLPDR